MLRPLLAACLAAGLALTPATSEAFCGFYVSGADQSLYANATMVVMMRSGQRTVLSMQNNYKGPPEDFAMVVPVPQVLQEENVKTLPREVFDRVDSLAAPRLVEYWETDPCAPAPPPTMRMMRTRVMEGGRPAPTARPKDLGVTIEAQFDVAEYNVVILSAKDSGGLDTWLRQENYNIPKGAESVLRPYVESGTKFFVAKVDSKKVTFKDGQAVLSPLRFHYDADDFSLPVRLGLLNSQGKQDLIVHILAQNQRYQVANYNNAFIPTNIRVLDGVRDDFGRFYDAIFEKTSKMKKRTVVTEYSWDASSCDPCPVPALRPNEIATLGADVLGSGPSRGFVLTRMHYRYGKNGLDEDLVFEAAPPIVGGRGTPDQNGEFREQGASPGPINNFQGRYAILHPWDGKVTCQNPRRGVWGGPPGKPMPPIMPAPGQLRKASTAPKGAPVAFASLLAEDIPSIGVTAGAARSTTDEGGSDEAPSPAGADETTATDEATPATEPSRGEPAGTTPAADVEPDAADASDTGCSVAPAGGALFALPLLALAYRRRRV